MTTELQNLVASLAGWVASTALKRLPRLAAWYQTLTGNGRRAVIIALSILVAVALYALRCFGFTEIPAQGVCDSDGWIEFLQAAILFALNSQAAFVFVPDRKPKPAPTPSP